MPFKIILNFKEKNMKKALKFALISLLVLVTCTFLFTACGEIDGNQDANSPTEDTPETDPHVHYFSEWIVEKEPTCTEKGARSRNCYCGATEAEEIDMIEHTAEVIPAVDATCTETGLTEGSRCSVCEEILVKQETVEIVEHTPVVDEAVSPSCTSKGYTEGSHCGVCDLVLVEQTEIPMLAHYWITDKAVEPTCSSYGYTEGSHCKFCGKIQVAVASIPKLPHTPVSVEGYEATCTENGLTDGEICTVCNGAVVSQKTIPALGHSFNKETNTCIRCPQTELPEIRSRNDLLAYEGTQNVVILLDKCITTTNTSEYWTLSIKPDATYVRIVGTAGVTYNFNIVVEATRTQSLKIELVNATLKSIVNSPVINIKCDKMPVEIEFYGESCKLIAKNGDKGSNGSITNISMNGNKGENGQCAIQSTGAVSLIVNADSAEIYGGNGGNGGNGMDGGIAPVDGGNGGHGGNGTYAISASSIDVYGSSNNLILQGGSGGAGGSGGSKGLGFFLSNGKNGNDGTSSVATTVSPTYH